MKSDLIGTLTIPWDQVASLQTSSPVTVVLPDGRSVQGTVQTQNGRLQLQGTPQQAPIGEVVAIRSPEEQRAYERRLHPGWTELWAGNANIGFAGTTGNASTRTFTATAAAARVTANDKTSVYFSTINSSAVFSGVNASTARAVRGGWAYNHDITSKLFLNVFNDYEYDRFQNLDLRAVFGGGLGYHAWKTERGALDLLAGADYSHSNFAALPPTPAFTRNSAEIYWGDDFTYAMSSATSLTQSFRMFNNLSQTGEYRINFDLSANTRLTRWLVWNFGLSNRYLSDPVPGRKTNDFLYTTGIGVAFAR
jgi:putative salt-induced outer membrane protein YdiY